MPAYTGLLRSKLPHTGTTIFTVMSALAAEYGAINLGQGFPDFLCDEKLLSLTDQYARRGFNQYAPMPGLLRLRERIAEKYETLHGMRYHPETEITVTPGGTEALYAAITAVVQEGDEVILFEPCYDSYAPAIELNGGVPVFLPLHGTDYHIQWDEVKQRINKRTRMILLNSPHNPTGAVLGAADMVQLEKLTSGTDIILLSDEVYEHLLFDGRQHQSVMRYPALAERSFVVYSFGKTYHNTGWKMGYCLAPAELMKEFRKVHQYLVFSVNTPYQHAFADWMEDASRYLGLGAFYQQKRDLFLGLLGGSRFQWEPAAGSYFQFVSYKNISEEKDTDFAIRLTKEAGVASVPVSVFYHQGYDARMLRFCFAKKDDTLKAAAERLCRL